MNTQNIFEDDWRACLRAHYAHVIKERDTNNETSLFTVLLETGFTEEDIIALRGEVLAELGWTPDGTPVEAVEVLQDEQPVEAPGEPVGAVPVGETVSTAETLPAEELAPVPSEPPADEADAAPENDQADGPDEPPAPMVQMSLF